jgi:hypothetical protein
LNFGPCFDAVTKCAANTQEPAFLDGISAAQRSLSHLFEHK